MTSDGTTTWVYGGNNRATQAGAASFLVNALGERVRKATASSATRFVYDEAGRLWGEYADDGTVVEETVWLGDLPVATLRPHGAATDIFYVHPDPLGTPRLVTRPGVILLVRHHRTELLRSYQAIWPSFDHCRLVVLHRVCGANGVWPYGCDRISGALVFGVARLYDPAGGIRRYMDRS